MPIEISATGPAEAAIWLTTGSTDVGIEKPRRLNGIPIAIAIGIPFNLLGFSIPTSVLPVVNQIAASAGPVALISIGMALTRYPIRGDINLATAVAVLKLTLMPAIV